MRGWLDLGVVRLPAGHMAAQFAAAKPREWIEHNTHSLMLRQAGRDMLEEQSAQLATGPSRTK